jgi:Domain of unknown function (DUF4249)
MKLNTQFIFFISAILLVSSCVEPFELVVKTDSKILIVDGSIDDSDRDKYITVKRFIPSSRGDIYYSPEVNAKVSVMEDGKTNFECFERPNGIYYLPVGFKTKIGSNYQLKILLSDGSEYISTNEKMKSTPKIQSSFVKFDPEGIDSGEKKTPAHLVYISTEDLSTKGDYYVWRWKLFEKQSYCITCNGGIYLTSPAPLGRCQTVSALAQQDISYDYGCNSSCWEIKYSEDINVMSDTYSNGNKISNRLVAKVPFYERSGFLIEVTQQNVSPAAFNYLKILGNQSQNNGTLVDSPPAPLIGNISNKNDKKESVGGFFMVGSSETVKIWVDRSDTGNSKPLQLLGRNAVLEPSSPPDRPPSAPCIKSNTRTPLKPEGWPF